tara:strand:- start:66 stop:386 length:321 start_codon:yes stop_codon:yes gene_type:complete
VTPSFGFDELSHRCLNSIFFWNSYQLLAKFPVSCLYIAYSGGKFLSQFLTEINRAMLATGASEGDCNIASIVLLEYREPLPQVIPYISIHIENLLLFIEEVNYRLV